MLLQVLVKAPGSPNRTTFLPLKMSLVLFQTGPSGVIIRNLVSGNRSPTLIVIRVLPVVFLQPSFYVLFCLLPSGLVLTSMARSSATAVNRSVTPSSLAPGGTPSSSNANRCRPAGAPGIGRGSGSAQSGVGPSAK